MTKELATINRERTIVGTPAILEMTLRCLHARGVLVTSPHRLDPEHLPGGRMSVTVVVAEPAPAPGRTERWRRWAIDHETATAVIKAGAFGIAVAGSILGAILLVISVITSVLTSFAHAVAGLGSAGALFLLALIGLWLAASVRSGHACRGLHCTGCKG